MLLGKPSSPRHSCMDPPDWPRYKNPNFLKNTVLSRWHQLGTLGNWATILQIVAGGNGNSLQYSFLENSMGRGAWWTIYMGPQSWTQLK